jgi:hypothetical protein
MARLKEALARETEQSSTDDLFNSIEMKATGPDLPACRTPSKTLHQSAPEPLDQSASGKRKHKEALKKKELRKVKRKIAKMEERDGPKPRDSAEMKHTSSSVPIFTTARASDAAVASTGYIGLNSCKEPPETFTLRELLIKKKFTLLRWDGRLVLCSFPYGC